MKKLRTLHEISIFHTFWPTGNGILHEIHFFFKSGYMKIKFFYSHGGGGGKKSLKMCLRLMDGP